MIRIATVTGVEFPAGEGNLAERAQTLEFGCLIHHPSLGEGASGISRQNTAGSAVGASLRHMPDVVEITPTLLTAGNLPLAF